MARKPKHLTLVEHPLVWHMLGEARARQTGSARFRELVSTLGGMIAYEATRDLATEPVTVQTPLEAYAGRRLRPPVTIVPILRAGLVLAEGVLRILPEAHVGHIGMFRDQKVLRPVSYYENLPLAASAGPVLLVDPMLATGGSALAAIHLLRNHGCQDIRLIVLVAAPEGVAKLAAECPQVPIFAAALDRELDDRGFILPGLGDAGDRMYGTD